MQILPPNKPKFRTPSFEKVCRYFLGDDWKEKYPVVELAIRNPKIAFYNDELAVWTKVLNGIRTFNWNADPSAYIIKGQPKAILKKGVHFYKLSYHHIGKANKRYVALRPATAGEQLPVWRRDASGKLSSSVGVAINQHKGGSDSTWSEGCQTAHFTQYPEFIQTIGNALGIKVQLGVVKNPDSRLMKGVGKFPYILIEQADFNYIVSLSESEFDSAADLKYQAANFVGVPKIEKVMPEVTEIENGIALLSAVEIEEEEDDFTLDIPLYKQILNQAESIAAGNVSQNAAISEPMSVTNGKDESKGAEATDGEAPAQVPENAPNLNIEIKNGTFGFDALVQKTQETFAKAQQAQETFEKAKQTISGVGKMLPGMKVTDAAIKVTSGKSTSFWLNMFGVVMSALAAVWGFVKENGQVIAFGILGIIVFAVTITVTFTVINHFKMKYFSDPQKYNVK